MMINSLAIMEGAFGKYGNVTIMMIVEITVTNKIASNVSLFEYSFRKSKPSLHT